MKIKHPILSILAVLLHFASQSQGLIIPSGGYVVVQNGNLILYRNLVNNGSFTHNGGTVIFSGVADTLKGSTPIAFKNIEVASGGIATISTAGQTLSDILLCNGTLNANGHLTLLSNATKTALIDGSGTGDVYGNVTMQRYLDTAFGYKYFSAPFQSATVSQFADDLDLTDSFPTFYAYDESLSSNGWVNYTDTTGTLEPMQGYAANFGASFSAKTITASGVVNNGTVSATLYNHNNTYTLGFNLAGNPYPSPVDWDISGGWTKTNVDDALYYFNTSDTNRYTGTYSTYIGGVSSDGVANNVIPAMQGFFIHVSNGSYPVTGSLSVSNTARINNFTPVFHKSSGAATWPLVRLDAGFVNNKRTDPVVIYFDDNAADIFNTRLDALKLFNTDVQVPNLYTGTKSVNTFSIKALPALTDSVRSVPLGLKAEQDGTIIFNTRNIEDIPQDIHVFLYDAATNYFQDLRTNPQYKLQLTAGTYENRFFIVFSKSDDVNVSAVTGELNVYAIGPKVFVYAPDSKSELAITNMAGQVVERQSFSSGGYHEVDVHTGSGVYVVTLVTEKGRQSKKIFIGSQ